MRMEELQTGFFGYRKESVYQLIASMEEMLCRKFTVTEGSLSSLSSRAEVSS